MRLRREVEVEDAPTWPVRARPHNLIKGPGWQSGGADMPLTGVLLSFL